MSAKNDELLQLAQLLADGSEISWPEASDAEDSGLDGDTLADLQALARLACFHREGFREARAEISLQLEQWGPLRLIEKVGEGAFGEVFLAIDSKLDREVALKLLRLERDDSQGRKRALREGRLLAKINHPNVAQVYGADEHGGRVGVWMEFVRGLTLDQMVSLQGPLSADEAGRVGLEVCRGLAAVHGQGLVHCDVKAQNIMRRQGGRILLVDFGLGAETGRSGNGAKRRVRGTPLYLAPERLRGVPAGRRSDLYALGVLLFFLTTESFPVVAEDLEELERLHGQGAGRLLSDVRSSLPGWFIDVVQTALSPDPQQRFATAGQMERALAAGLAPALLKPPSAPRKRRRRPAWAALLVLLLAAALASWYFLKPAPPRVLKPAGIVLAGLVNYTSDEELSVLSDYLRDDLSQGVDYFELADDLDLAPARAELGLDEKQPLQMGSGLKIAQALYETPVVIQPEIRRLGDTYLVRVFIRIVLKGEESLKQEWIEHFQISKKHGWIDQIRAMVQWIRGTALPGLRARSRYAKAMKLKNDRPDNAIDELSRAVRDDPKFFLGYAQRGSILVGQQRFAKGFEDFETANRLLGEIERPKDQAEFDFARMLVANNTEDYRRHVAYSQEKVDRELAKPRRQRQLVAFFELGFDQYALRRFEQARESFDIASASQVDRLKTSSLAWSARMSMVLNQFPRAEEAIRSLDPDSVWKQLLAGVLAFLQQDYDEADNAFQRMRTVGAGTGGESDGFAVQGLLQAERGQYSAALRTLQEGIDNDTQRMALADEPRPLQGRRDAKLLARAVVNLQLLQLDPENEEISRAIVADCRDATTTGETMLLARAGIILAQAGLLEEAKEYAKLVDEHSFDIPISRRWQLKLKGELQLAEGDAKGGLESLEKAAIDDPALYPLEYLARALAQAGQREQAALEYQKILARPGIFWIRPVNEMRPGLYAQTLLDWGRLAFDLGKFDEAKEALERYLALRKDADDSLSGYREEARQMLEKPARK